MVRLHFEYLQGEVCLIVDIRLTFVVCIKYYTHLVKKNKNTQDGKKRPEHSKS